MKNKGFTFIEVVSVLSILSLLSILAITSVTKIVRDKRNDAYKEQINSILSSAISYVATDESITLSSPGSIKIQLGNLIDKGFVEEQVLSNEYYNLNGQIVKFKRSDNITVQQSTSKPKYNQKYDGKYLYTLQEPEVIK